MTVELVGEHFEVARKARELICAAIAAPLAQGALTAIEISPDFGQVEDDQLSEAS